MGIGWLFLFIGAGIFFVIVLPLMRADNQEKQLQIQNEQRQLQSRQSSKENIVSTAVKNGFKITKQIDNIDNTACLAIDITNHKFLIKTAESSGAVLDFKQLVSYELCKDGNTIVSGDASGALLGGLLFGTVGAVAGAAASNKTVNNICSSMYISVVDMNAVRYRIMLISKPTHESSSEYSLIMEKARDMLSMLDVINKFNKGS